ncbi:hypothetical protein GOBAR_AA36145 [Gossypium barbadense]|uniref:Uncharacterized protein n=1 Tax=Gossypium barbadense TaxID=3634 RepID=A0A2P5W0F9_GOSBA|nr:hypothetical protein GOBAR_AA36145 [Gossypium barbadense]
MGVQKLSYPINPTEAFVAYLTKKNDLLPLPISPLGDDAITSASGSVIKVVYLLDYSSKKHLFHDGLCRE